MLADALALAAALLCASSGGASPAIELHPSSLVLGRGETARVVVRWPDGVPRLATSAGTLGPARETAPGVFEAVLQPPVETFPQLAIVAAVSPAGAALAVLPLVGRGVAVAHTEPNASITVEIRGRVFGPVLADGEGIARVPVEVPPGVQFALHRGKPLDLRVPPLRQVLVVLEPPALRADREETVRVHVFAATPEGAPWAGAPLELSASAGRLGPAREVAPGITAAEWIVPAGPAGAVALEARLPQGLPARQEVARPAGPPARVAVRLGAERVVAGDAPVEVLVDVSDAAGNHAGGDVHLASSFGELSPPVRDATGALRAALRVPERLEGRVQAIVEAKAGDVAERRSVALVPAAAARVSVVMTRPELKADGRSASDVSIAVTDRFGNGVDDPPPAIAARGGKVAPASRIGPGLYRTRYAPRWRQEDGEDAVVVRVGSVAASAPVRLLAVPRQVGVTARAGALHAFGGFTAPVLGAAIEVWPTALGGRLGLAFAMARASSGRTGQVDLGGAPHPVETSSVLWPLELTVMARRPLHGRFTGLLGAGGRAVLVESTAALDGARTAGERGWAVGAQAQAGVAYEVPSWHARARLDALVAWQADPGMSSFRGTLATFGLALGVTHDVL